jgi:hypothetical protein
MAADIFLTTAIYGGDPLKSIDAENLDGDESLAHPLAKFVEKAQLDYLHKAAGVHDFRWDEPVSVSTDAPMEKSAPKNGVVVEKIENQTWRYRYAKGSLVKIELEDPEIEGGRMEFDGNGNEIAA